MPAADGRSYSEVAGAIQARGGQTIGQRIDHEPEKGWFLMQTRWMLWLEEGKNLAFLKMAPRRWFEQGERIELKNVATYFGPASLSVESNLAKGRITAAVSCRAARRPGSVTIRLPHPDGRKAVAAVGGRYDPEDETVRSAAFKGTAKAELRF